MKKLRVLAVGLLGSACAAQAQLAPGVSNEAGNVAQEFAATPGANATLSCSHPVFLTGSFSLPGMKAANTPVLAAALALPLETAEPPAPSPTPRFLYGGRDDYRFQLGLGLTVYRFQNSVFTATAVGIKTSVSYFLNDWLGVEGNVSAAFASQIFVNEHVKTLLYGGGPKIAWRQKRWEPWLHAIMGGAHEAPQTSAGNKNAFAVQLGGGADYRFNPRFSGRLEGDYVRSTFFSQGQNNFEATAGVVLHF